MLMATALRAIEAKPAGSWSGPASDSVTLDYEERHRRRLTMRGSGGIQFLLDLPRATLLRDGDGLLLEDGRVIRVYAAAEPLLEVQAVSMAALVRLAWHLGNRHLPTQLLGDRLRIRPDHVIAAMLEQLGGRVSKVEAPFDPEGGAYSSHHGDEGSGQNRRGVPGEQGHAHD